MNTRATLVPLPTGTKLYFRFFCNNAGLDGVPTKAGIPCPDQSVNSEVGGGKPWFLLLPEPKLSLKQNHRGRCSGIVELRRDAFPFKFPIGGVEYTADVEHDPEAHNYQHCEVRIYAGGTRLSLDEAQRLNQRQYEQLVSAYRAVISKRISLVLWPNPCTRPNDWNSKRLAKTACCKTCP
jgi:hypothetical protein